MAELDLLTTERGTQCRPSRLELRADIRGHVEVDALYLPLRRQLQVGSSVPPRIERLEHELHRFVGVAVHRATHWLRPGGDVDGDRVLVIGIQAQIDVVRHKRKIRRRHRQQSPQTFPERCLCRPLRPIRVSLRVPEAILDDLEVVVAVDGPEELLQSLP